MPQKSRKLILSQMFDVKPMKEDGNLHLEKIHSVKKCLNLKYIAKVKEKQRIVPLKLNNNFSRLPDGRVAREVFASILTSYYQPSLKTTAWQSQPTFKKSDDDKNKNEVEVKLVNENQKIINELAANFGQEGNIELASPELWRSGRRKILADLENILSNPLHNGVGEARDKKLNEDFLEIIGKYGLENNREQSEARVSDVTVRKDEDSKQNQTRLAEAPARRKIIKPMSSVRGFAILASVLFLIVLGVSFARGSLNSKDLAISYAISASQQMMDAKEDLKNLDFKAAEYKFIKAGKDFKKSKEAIGSFNYIFLSAASSLPILSSSKLSGINLIDAGEYLAESGKLLSEDMVKLSSFNFKDIFQPNGKSELILNLENLNKDLDIVLSNIIIADKNIKRVDFAVLPDNFRDQDFADKISQFKKGIIEAQKYVKLSLKLLGSEREQDYLLLFQNPSEMRASGGFIGSYGIIKLDNGKAKEIFIDDIFNPDGQLKEKIIPPFPIQKISTAWSMHDSNWFFDFPTSAQKVAWFYEKTGGPSVNGVVALNPMIIEKLLEITGPIDLPEYGVAVIAENFVDTIQFKVEKDFNKEENKPKKILADFMPKFLERLFSQKNNLPEIFRIFADSITEKDMMIYSFDEEAQKLISANNFSGAVAKSQSDYLAVVSSNINGYKTDRIIDGNINLKSEVSNDGSIINTLTIKKHHNGGNSNFDYYNKVSADYLRVYVPEGSVLLDARGHTIEENKSPVDYKQLGFKEDKNVARAESSMIIDEKTKTHIYKEFGKTVFGNWVFVSPGKDVEVVYKYRLPKLLNLNKEYEMVFQKQSGGKMKLSWDINFANNARILSDDKELIILGASVSLRSDFKEDKRIILNIKN